MLPQSCDHCCTKVQNLCVKFAGQDILTDVNVHINCGELIAIVGPNGAGKTTLLRAILGEIPYKGSIQFRVKGASRENPKIGYVPQKLNFDMDSPISVEDFIALSVSAYPVWLGVPVWARKTISDSLDRVSARHIAKRRIGELSGGELQRILLAMAMTPPPALLLLDEPMSGVDAKGLTLFYEIVSSLKKAYDVAIILVTHDLAGVAPHADRMILLNKTVVAEGKPADVLSNERLVRTLGPSLWNISTLPDFRSFKQGGRPDV